MRILNLLSLAGIITVSGLLPITVSAQDTLKVTLPEALNIAITDNPTIKIADKEIERQQYYKKEIMGGLLPSLSGSAQYNRNVKPQVIFMPKDIFGPGTGGPMQMGSDNSYTAGLSASLPLFAPTLYKSIQVTEVDIELAVEKSRASKIDLVNQVKKAYYTNLLTRNAYEVLQQSMKNAQQNLEKIKNMYGQGLVAEYDLIRADVSVRNIKPNLVQAENSNRLANIMLKVLMGVPENVVLEVEGNLSEYEQQLTNNAIALSTSIEENTDLKQLDIQQRKLELQLQLLKSQRLPTLAAFGNYQWQTQANDFKFSNYEWVQSFMAGFQLQVPIFNGFAKRNKEKQVAIGIDQLQMQRNYVANNITTQAKNALVNMIKAAEQVESNKEGIALAQKGYSIAQTRYQTGTGTYLELNDAEVALTQSQLNYNQAIYDYLNAKVEYEKIIGTNHQSTEKE